MKKFQLLLFIFSTSVIAGLKPYDPEIDNPEKSDYSNPLDFFSEGLKSLDESFQEFDDNLKDGYDSDTEIRDKVEPKLNN